MKKSSLALAALFTTLSIATTLPAAFADTSAAPDSMTMTPSPATSTNTPDAAGTTDTNSMAPKDADTMDANKPAADSMQDNNS